jgi:hypothetical protein
MIFLGEYAIYAIYALEFIGAALAMVVIFIIAFYAIVWGFAVAIALLDCGRPPKRMEPRCSECGSPKWLGKPGEKVCTNCGAQER